MRKMVILGMENGSDLFIGERANGRWQKYGMGMFGQGFAGMIKSEPESDVQIRGFTASGLSLIVNCQW